MRDIKGPVFAVGDIVQVNGSIGEYNGAPQVIGTCMKVDPTPEIARSLVPVAPIDVDAEFAFMWDCANRIADCELRNITLHLLDAHKTTLLSTPAGMSMHHNYIGGWVEHTVGILRGALALYDLYKGRLNYDLLCSGAILHDIGKIYEFQRSEFGTVQDYTFLGNGVGHASLGVGMIMARVSELCVDVASPSVAALLNIVGTHAGRREWGACADPVCKEAMVISNLDYIDSHLNAFDTALEDVPYGDKAYSKSMKCNVFQTRV